MGYKKLSNEQEKQLIEEYKQGASVISLMLKYNFKSKKSITDKVKKHYPDTYNEIIKEALNNRKSYNYCLNKINNNFDAYFLGLLLTDGYISREYDIGIDLTDEDCISFLSKTIGKDYQKYEGSTYKTDTPKPRYRLIFSNKEMVENLQRLGVVPNKTATLQPPKLLSEEEKFLPYIIRGIIDGDGCVSSTSYGGALFFIVTQSKDFANWLVDVLTNKLFMIDIHIRQNSEGLYRIETSNQHNILKLIALVYDKPFGMSRKYEQIRKTFRDYNGDALLENNKDEGIVQTTTLKMD